MSAHTPGPWRVSADRPYWGVYAVRDPNEVDTRIADCDTEADAHLIAAAPTLLAACEAALAKLHDSITDRALWPDQVGYECITYLAYAQVRRAIAKARGEVTP